MRTNEPRVVPSIRFLGYLSAAGAIGVALAACSSSLHIDPTGGTGAGTGSSASTGAGGASPTTTTGGGGSGPVIACDSNPDCKTPEKSICDTVTHQCTQCLVNSDCDQSQGLTCFGGACGCPIDGTKLCSNATGVQCVDTLASKTDCGDCGHSCFGACAAGKCEGPWEKTTLDGAPEARTQHVAVWAESKMIVWGGRTVDGATNTGGVYDLALNKWTLMKDLTSAPSPRLDATAVWDDTGKRMIVWGGRSALDTTSPLNTGAFYYPAKDMWVTIDVKPSVPPDVAATPFARWGHTAAWTGTKMIIWGGTDGLLSTIMDSASFDPLLGKWETVPVFGGHRTGQAATWAGTTLFVWAGFGNDDGVTPEASLVNGSTYEPGMAWMSLNGVNPLTARSQASAVSTDSGTIVWGGVDGTMYFNTGAKYSGGAGWFSTSAATPPSGRIGHSAGWVKTPNGDRMIIWGGRDAASYFNDGALLDTTVLDWKGTLPTGPTGRAHHSTVVNGTARSKMIIWGGELSASKLTNTGAIFDASAM